MSHYWQGVAREEKRRQLLDGAYKLFTLKGYNKVTVDEIVDLADTAKGTVYNYFGNKEQLFFTLIQERSNSYVITLHKIAESDRQVLDKINAVVKLTLEFCLENGQLWETLIVEVRNEVSPETREKYLEIFNEIISLVEGILREGISQGFLVEHETTNVVYGLLGIIKTLVYHDLVGVDIDAAVSSIINIFLYGLAKK